MNVTEKDCKDCKACPVTLFKCVFVNIGIRVSQLVKHWHQCDKTNISLYHFTIIAYFVYVKYRDPIRA